MKKFNKNKALTKLHKNKNKRNIKITSILASITLLIGALILFSYARFESTVSYSLIDATIEQKILTIPQQMAKLIKTGATDLTYDGTDTYGEYGTVDNNMRYIGANPSNYVYFNCSTSNIDEMNDTTCEKWRIVGSFNNVEDENKNKATRVKIMRNDYLGTNYSWDSSSVSGINQWGEADGYEGADLMRELNTDYLGNITVGTNGMWYSNSSNKKEAPMPSTTLNTNAQNMIQTVNWPTATVGDALVSYDRWLSYLFYQDERSGSFEKFCSTSVTNGCDNYNRTPNWIGKIGLIHASDYTYSSSGGSTKSKIDCANTYSDLWAEEENSDCKNNSWIYDSSNNQWTLSPVPYNDYSNNVMGIFSTGIVRRINAAPGAGVRPALFLKSNIKVLDGDGSESNPYKLSV